MVLTWAFFYYLTGEETSEGDRDDDQDHEQVSRTLEPDHRGNPSP